MAKKVEEIEEIKEVKQVKKFYVANKIKLEGYVADIAGNKFVVTPQLMGQTINPLTNNREYGVVTPSKCIIYDLVNSMPVVETAKEFNGYFEGLNKEQERQLLIAGVIE